ncbi:MAG TPA: protease inhibitor I42 family protein [Prolixibacteraceae bacterium]|nr:protease inhibitor I42 family protein [Prolixibacteraceae bacterium]
MKMIKKMLYLISLSCFLFVACEKDDPNAGIVADYEVAVGEDFQIEMNANHTTGYEWKWTNEASVAIVDTIGWTYESEGGGEMIDGSGGKEIWTFTGISKGLDTLFFEYCRSWEANSSVDTLQYIVRVK